MKLTTGLNNTISIYNGSELPITFRKMTITFNLTTKRRSSNGDVNTESSPQRGQDHPLSGRRYTSEEFKLQGLSPKLFHYG